MTKSEVNDLRRRADKLFMDISNALIAARGSAGESVETLHLLTQAKRSAWESVVSVRRISASKEVSNGA